MTLETKCIICNKLTFNRCIKCKSQYYCDTKCQRKDYPIHKRICDINTTQEQCVINLPVKLYSRCNSSITIMIILIRRFGYTATDIKSILMKWCSYSLDHCIQWMFDRTYNSVNDHITTKLFLNAGFETKDFPDTGDIKILKVLYKHGRALRLQDVINTVKHPTVDNKLYALYLKQPYAINKLLKDFIDLLSITVNRQWGHQNSDIMYRVLHFVIDKINQLGKGYNLGNVDDFHSGATTSEEIIVSYHDKYYRQIATDNTISFENLNCKVELSASVFKYYGECGTLMIQAELLDGEVHGNEYWYREGKLCTNSCWYRDVKYRTYLYDYDKMLTLKCDCADLSGRYQFELQPIFGLLNYVRITAIAVLYFAGSFVDKDEYDSGKLTLQFRCFNDKLHGKTIGMVGNNCYFNGDPILPHWYDNYLTQIQELLTVIIIKDIVTVIIKYVE